MSLLIKGMEMPCSCLTCRIAGARGGEYYCNLQTKEQNQSATTLTELYYGCPLVEVKTPHGRLIDADALSAMFEEPIDVFLARLDLRCPPTIVPAEGGGEDG